MSWLDTVAELAGSDIGAGPGASYARGAVITQAVREGASGNAIVDALSAAGLGFRRGQVLDAISSERARQAAGGTSFQIDLSQPTSSILAATPPDGWTGQYVHQVMVRYRTRDSEGDYMPHIRTLGIKSSTLLTSEEAYAAAVNIMSQDVPSEEEGQYPLPSDILMGGLSGVWYDVNTRHR